MSLHDDIAEVLITEEDLHKKIVELGQAISRDYAGQDVLLIAVLKGATIFLSDLMRQISIPHEIDFMAISSYEGKSTESTGVVRIIMDLETNIRDRNVLIVEDIIDSGYTLQYIVENLETRRPASIHICCLLEKPERREVDIPIDYLGFSIPNRFVVGYGLDYDSIYRNLPYIGVLRPELYAG